MSARKARRRPKKTTEPPAPPPLAERLQVERERLFRAMAVIACCRLACVSKYDDGHPEDMAGALEAVYDIVDETAGQLGVIVDEQSREVLEPPTRGVK